MAQITPDPVNPQASLEVSEFKSPSEISNAAALQLTVQDTQSTESYLQSNYWSLRWREADALYQSPPGMLLWEGTTVARSNVNRFVVAETVNAILPQVLNGLFYETPAFVLRPRPEEDENTTRAITSLLSIQLTELRLRQEVSWGLHSVLNFGTGIWKWGFRSRIDKIRKYVRAKESVKVPSTLPDEPDTEIETPESIQYVRKDEDVPVHGPTFEAKDIRYVLVESGCRVPDIRRAKFVIDRMYLTYRDLIRLKDEEYVVIENGKQTLKKRYMLPSEAEIKSWFESPKDEAEHPGNQATEVQGTTFVHHAKAQFTKTTADPLDEPLEILERWDNDKVITVLQRVKCIRNEPNEFSCIPFLSLNWWNIPDAFWGLGLGRVIGVEQRVQAGIINACLDLANLIVNPMWARSRGANIQEQQIRQRIGGIIAVDGPIKDALHMLEQPHIPAEVVQQIGLSEARVEKTSGANQQLTMGASGGAKGGGQMGRSGTGAAGIIQATMNRVGGLAEDFSNQVYEPLLYKMHEMNRDKLPMPYIRKVLGSKLGKAFKFNPDDFMSAPAEFEVLAGSHLAAKAQMAQSLFLMLQTFENAPLMEQLSTISNKKINIEELFHMIHDVSGFKNYYNIVVDMTPEEIAAQKQKMDPQAQKLQGQMQLNQQKFGQDQQIVDQENEARITRDIFRQLAEKATLPEVLTGQPPTEGVGSIEAG